MNFMSSWKPAWHLDRIEALRSGRNIVPTHLHLIMSDLCNQNCHFCSYRMDGGLSTELFWEEENRNPARFLPTAKAKEILNDFAALGGRAVQFQGGGEPTVHPEHQGIIGHAQSLGLETGLVTNGIRLADLEVFRRLDWLRISLDAGCEKTYREIKESGAWKKVMENMRMVGSWDGPNAGAGFVVTKENYTEIEKALRIVKKAGLSHLRVREMVSTDSHYYDGMDVHIPDDPMVIDNFNPGLRRPPSAFCGYQQFTLYVGADQCVYTCCTNAYTTHGKIGDLRDSSFMEWVSTSDRLSFDADQCRHCDFTEQNEIISYLVGEPESVNFT